jgi:hypothetical protein
MAAFLVRDQALCRFRRNDTTGSGGTIPPVPVIVLNGIAFFLQGALLCAPSKTRVAIVAQGGPIFKDTELAKSFKFLKREA